MVGFIERGKPGLKKCPLIYESLVEPRNCHEPSPESL